MVRTIGTKPAYRQRKFSRLSWSMRVTPISFMPRTISASSMAERALDPSLAGGGERVKVEPPARDRRGAEAERLEHVRAAPNAAVEDHFHPVADRVDDLGELVERRAAAVELAAAVVGDHDRVARPSPPRAARRRPT